MKLLWALLMFSAHAAQAGSPTHVAISGSLRADSACATTLIRTAEYRLDQLHAQGGKAVLAYLPELQQALAQVGISRTRARQITQAITPLRVDAAHMPSLAFTASVLDELVRTRLIVVCALSVQCTLAQMDANHIAFTRRGGEAIVIVPPAPTISAQRWSLNFLGSVATLAAERMLMRWLPAAYSLEQLQSGSSDAYYTQFALDYDGLNPPHPESLREGFAPTFMSLYQYLVTQMAFAHFYPAEADANRRHLATFGYSNLTKTICDELGVTEENFFEKTDSILNAMLSTIERAHSLD